MKKSASVPAYILAAPPAVQKKLREMRAIIRAIVPRAEESISYGMPQYKHNGVVAYFGYTKEHIGLYIPPPILTQNADSLTGYSTSKSAVRLPLEKKLPATLIKKLLRARLRYNAQQ
jgi:uncharacterized protein YdhG (YjbR/CyaY superfamily)